MFGGHRKDGVRIGETLACTRFDLFCAGSCFIKLGPIIREIKYIFTFDLYK